MELASPEHGFRGLACFTLNGIGLAVASAMGSITVGASTASTATITDDADEVMLRSSLGQDPRVYAPR